MKDFMVSFKSRFVGGVWKYQQRIFNAKNQYDAVSRFDEWCSDDYTRAGTTYGPIDESCVLRVWEHV